MPVDDADVCIGLVLDFGDVADESAHIFWCVLVAAGQGSTEGIDDDQLGVVCLCGVDHFQLVPR